MALKVIVVDDERLALRNMERVLEGQIELGYHLDTVKTFHNPYAALEIVQQENFDVAFLDIEMPEINGLELADQILSIQPNIQIVFVTAYQDYAVKAFEMNVLDYLLKPVNQNRLAMTMQRVMVSISRNVESSEETGQSKLCCLQKMSYIDMHGVPQSFPWKTLKASELFAYLVNHHDKTVNKQTLIDLLWPEHDLEKATTQLHTAIYQIRKIIKEASLNLKVKYKDGGYSFVLGQLKLDVEEWVTSVWNAPALTADTLEYHLNILAQYRGDYLEEHRYTWAEFEQDRIRLIWLEHTKGIAQYYFSLGQYTEAMVIYQMIVDRVPHLEDGYYGLMQIYDKLNHQLEVTKQFQLITDILREDYGVQPSKGLNDWYEHWLVHK
jgi:two-component system LytT family response regulator